MFSVLAYNSLEVFVFHFVLSLVGGILLTFLCELQVRHLTIFLAALVSTLRFQCLLDQSCSDIIIFNQKALIESRTFWGFLLFAWLDRFSTRQSKQSYLCAHNEFKRHISLPKFCYTSRTARSRLSSQHFQLRIVLCNSAKKNRRKIGGCIPLRFGSTGCCLFLVCIRC